MARSLRLIWALTSAFGAFCFHLAFAQTAPAQSVTTQTEPPPGFIKGAEACQFINAIDEVGTVREYVWTGQCKDGLGSGAGVLSYPRTNLSWTGDFVAGEMRPGVFKMRNGATY